MINIEEKERITKFIKNPIKTGIWETIFEWNNQNEIESKISESNSTGWIGQAITPLTVLEIFNFLVQEEKTKQQNHQSIQTSLPQPIVLNTTPFSLPNWENIHYFNESYNLYYQQKYDNSISYVGKMTESLLTNIYESLFQEHVPEGFAIGQIQNSIQSKVKDIYRNDNNTVEPANFEKIRDFCRDNMDTIPLIHQITTLLKDEQKYRDSLLIENQSMNIEYSIFPKHILTNLKKLLNYRNSVSHNSGTFFNIYDCQKMLFYFLSVYNWWQEVYDTIDWTKEEIEIIKEIVRNRE